MIALLNIKPRLAFAVWMRNFTIYRRTWTMNLLPNFFEPVLYLVGMGIGLGAYLHGDIEGQSYLTYIAPGLMAASAMNGASFEATYNMFVKMNFDRLYDAYLSTPADVQDIAAGELAWAVTRSLIYSLAFLVILLGLSLFGYEVLTSWWALCLPFALTLIGLVFGLIGQMFTSLITLIDLYAYYYTLFLTPLFLFSGIFFPVSRFPYGETIAWFSPLYHAVRLCKDLAYGQLSWVTAADTLWLVVLAALLAVGVLRKLRGRMIS